MVDPDGGADAQRPEAVEPKPKKKKKQLSYRWQGLEMAEEMLVVQEDEEEEAAAQAGAVRRVFEATEEQRQLVQKLATAGVQVGQIALMVKWPGTDRPISLRTLWNHFRQELTEGKIQANATVAGSLYKLALAGNVTAQIFWLKTQAGWRDPNTVELSGRDGKPLPQNAPSSGVIVLPAGSTPESWEAVVAKQQADLAQRAAEMIGDVSSD